MPHTDNDLIEFHPVSSRDIRKVIMALRPNKPPQGVVSVIKGSLRIDNFRMTTPLDYVNDLLRMLIWAFAGVAPKSMPLLTAIRRRPKKSRTWNYFQSFPYILQRIFPDNSSVTLGTCSFHKFSICLSVFIGVTTRRINTIVSCRQT